jgi:2-polyprenyl-3-methyl-5-hydroxy-6-metoxy-1,4-benzoquinol methylase
MSGSEKVFEHYRTAGFTDTSRAAVDEGYSELLAWLPQDKGAFILDLGCGGGEFLDFLRRSGFRELHGVDYSGEQVARCHDRGLPFVTKVADAKAFLRTHVGQFDCVVMNDVLEHIPKADCIATLEEVRHALKPGGALLVKVPNAANVFGLVARYLDFTHEIAFTEHSLRQVLLASGYRDVEVKGPAVRLRLTPRRVVYWTMNRVYTSLHRAAYVAAVGADAPTILAKLLISRARA